MSECVLCHNIMGHSTIPRYIIDWDSLELQGRAHTGCVREISSDIRFYPIEEPTPKQLIFASLLRNHINAFNEKYEGRFWDQKDFRKYLLAVEALFKVSNIEEFQALPRVLELTDWWLNGSKIISQGEYDDIFDWIKTLQNSEVKPE